MISNCTLDFIYLFIFAAYLAVRAYGACNRRQESNFNVTMNEKTNIEAVDKLG